MGTGGGIQKDTGLMRSVKEMSNDQLSNELMYWFRVGRNEGGLKDDERKFFRAVCNEMADRRILDRSNTEEKIRSMKG